jgi:dihydrolipoamide dehydrogenase
MTNMEADVASTNVFSDDEKTSVDYQTKPWANFTWPQIGHVGLTEQQAIKKGYQIFVAIKPYSSIAKGFAMGYDKNDIDDGFVKLIVSRNRKILGAHVIGPNAAILVQQLVYLMKAGVECYMPDEEEGMKFVSSMACPEAGSIAPLYKSQVIHPSLNEVVGWSLGALRPINIDFKQKGHHHHHDN